MYILFFTSVFFPFCSHRRSPAATTQPPITRVCLPGKKSHAMSFLLLRVYLSGLNLAWTIYHIIFLLVWTSLSSHPSFSLVKSFFFLNSPTWQHSNFCHLYAVSIPWSRLVCHQLINIVQTQCNRQLKPPKKYWYCIQSHKCADGCVTEAWSKIRAKIPVCLSSCMISSGCVCFCVHVWLD